MRFRSCLQWILLICPTLFNNSLGIASDESDKAKLAYCQQLGSTTVKSIDSYCRLWGHSWLGGIEETVAIKGYLTIARDGSLTKLVIDHPNSDQGKAFGEMIATIFDHTNLPKPPENYAGPNGIHTSMQISVTRTENKNYTFSIKPIDTDH